MDDCFYLGVKKMRSKLRPSMPPWAVTSSHLLAALIVGAFAGFLGGYFKRKGENLATHEDINHVVDQVRAITTTTEQIKAEISGSAWDRQKQWELKREVLVGAARVVAEVDGALLGLASAFHSFITDKQSHWNELQSDMIMRWAKADDSFDETRLLVAMVCGKEIQKAFGDLETAIRTISKGILAYNINAYSESKQERGAKLSACRDAIRKELGIE